jgi:hypothetical protein
VSFGKKMPELGAALGRALDLGVDLFESSHASLNALARINIP